MFWSFVCFGFGVLWVKFCVRGGFFVCFGVGWFR
jgi:hypothetical protein